MYNFLQIYTYLADYPNPEHKSALKDNNDCNWLIQNVQRLGQLIGQKWKETSPLINCK